MVEEVDVEGVDAVEVGLLYNHRQARFPVPGPQRLLALDHFAAEPAVALLVEA